MIRHIEAAPLTVHDKPISILWDDEAGTVSGDGAAYIKDVAGWGECNTHPHPSSHRFSAQPLKSMEDMAVIVGYRHLLPDWLAAHYPAVEYDEIEAQPGAMVTY